MTVSNNSMMASQMYANKDVQAQSGASGTWNGASQAPGMDFSAIAQQLMTTMDTNKNGTIDKAEFSQAAQALAKNANNSSNSNVDAAFAKMDTNGDGQINSDEMMAAMKQASTQPQGKHHHGGHHHTDASASTASASSTDTSSSPTQTPSPMNEMQKNLFNKIMAAYGTSSPATGMTTSLSA